MLLANLHQAAVTHRTCSTCRMSAKLGRLSGACCQHECSRRASGGGQPAGIGSRSFSTPTM